MTAAVLALRPSPLTPEQLALARETLSDAGFLSGLNPWHRAELVRASMSILRIDREARLGPRPKPTTPARIVRIPLAVFQANRNHHPDPTDPKDAA